MPPDVRPGSGCVARLRLPVRANNPARAQPDYSATPSKREHFQPALSMVDSTARCCAIVLENMPHGWITRCELSRFPSLQRSPRRSAPLILASPFAASLIRKHHAIACNVGKTKNPSSVMACLQLPNPWPRKR